MYTRLLETHPLITKCVTSGLVMSAGDLLTQKRTSAPTQSSKNALRSIGLGI